MGKIWDFLLTNNWEEYQRVQLYKKLGKKLEPQEQPKKMGFGEAMANVGVAIAQSRLNSKKGKGKNITFVNGRGEIISIKKVSQRKNKKYII